MKKRRLESISALRALAFVGVFLRHVDLTKATGNWAVSVFIVMSGFLMIYNNYEKDINFSSPKECFAFGIKKIKIYPLHVITLIAMFILEFFSIISSMDNYNIRSIIGYTLKVVLNLFLLHAWIPIEKVYFSINGVSWYLSTALFLYTMFPLILKFLKKSSIKHDIYCCVIVYLMQIIITAISLLTIDNNAMLVWITYVCPVFRLGDFFIGCVAGKLFVKNFIVIQSTNYISIVEILFIVFIVPITLLFIRGNYDSFALCVISKPTLICLPSSAVIVYLFALNKGWLVKLLSKKTFLFLGEISMNAYLIHNVVIRYVEVINRLLLNGVLSRTCYVIICFVLTLLASYFYGILVSKLRENRLKN